ncbi:MAG: amidophosphoribosyltransferase [Thermoproteus sp.]|nr:amidophosphoribosyltransferase [Thermoproteus sp.]
MCGIGGVWGGEAAERAVEMARWLMHRGEEGIGYAYLTKDGLMRGEAVPRDASAAVVHARYSTTGPYGVQIQPVVVKYRDFEAAVAFNGTIVNFRELAPGAENDVEALARKFAELTWEHGLVEGLRELYAVIEGAASIVALTHTELIGVRDARGIRPLAFTTDAVASEDVALGSSAFELGPGRAVVVSDEAKKLIEYSEAAERLCALELVYFAHPASKLHGSRVGEVRRLLGRMLADGEGVEVDAVAYIPETARAAAAGYAEALGKPLMEAVVKNRYAGRVFIKPPQSREPAVAFRVVDEAVRGKRIALVDDSLIRGTNLGVLVRALRAAGAAEIHLRIASPPVKWPCYYGMDFQDPAELAASGRSVEEIARGLGADTLRYLDMEKFRRALGNAVCYGCFTGIYPTKITARPQRRR